MNIYLHKWKDIYKIICLNTETGEFSELEKNAVTTDLLSGIASKIGDKNRNFCAIYVNNKKIWLQFNALAWDIVNDNISIKYKRFLIIEIVKIQKGKECVFKKIIKSTQAFINLLSDPTTDRIDEYSEYFILWLSKTINKKSWIELFLKKGGNIYTLDKSQDK